jgi:hypothetical protein
MTHPDDHVRDELQPVIDLLRAHRPEATALELDATKRRVLARARNGSNKSRSGFMRSRAAILSTLVLGFLLSSVGASLAVTGFAGNDQASVAQYPVTVQPQQPQSAVPPAANAPADTPPLADVGGESDEGGDDQQVIPDSDEEAAPDVQPDVQPDRQVAAGFQAGDDSELPFTGFAAIPILLIGLALLSGGLVMRRSARTG